MERQQWNQSLPGRPRGRESTYEGHDNHHYRPNHAPDVAFAKHQHAQQVAGTKDGRSHTQDPRRRRSPVRLSLEDAMTSLYECATEARAHFDDFHQDFKRDIRGIQEYCNQRIIDAVWAQKVRGGHRDHDAQTERRGSGRHDGHPAEQQDVSLRSTMKALLSTTSTAAGAAEDFRPSQRRPSRYTPDDVSKIRHQLHRSHQNLRKSFGVLMGSRSEMEHVTTELEMLLLFLSRNGAGDATHSNYEPGAKIGRQRMGATIDDDGPYGESGEQVEEWTGPQE
ncbi:MAG: hypothetical protein Q9222_001551 [Ikaeria aurantiellina]